MRNHVLHFDTAHSSPHEGTNHGLKSHSCAVQPVMNLDTSAKTLNTQSIIKAHELEALIFEEANRTQKKWSNLPTSSHAVSLAEGILLGMMKRVHLYQSHLVHRDLDRTEFHVTYSGADNEEDVSEQLKNNLKDGNDFSNDIAPIATHLCPIPLFSRTRIVTIDASGVMLCSCKHFERVGLPCVHQASVSSKCHSQNIDTKSSVDSVFLGFTHHDILVRWWSQYLYYAYRPSTPSVIVQQLHSLAINPIKGPKLRCDVSGDTSLDVVSREILPAIYRVKCQELSKECYHYFSTATVCYESTCYSSVTNTCRR
jgi:hypothetical protein